ncbi:MAG: Transposase family protein [Gemmataceae bacterium]|nr:Transposase family protein [Gemmataceae bacterium]
MRLNSMSTGVVDTTAPPAPATPAPTPATPPPAPSALPPDARLPDDLDTLKRMVRELLDQLRSRDRELSGVRHRLDQLLRRLYGPKGETFRPDQPGLFELLDEAAAETAGPAAPQPATPPAEPMPTRSKRTGHGRRPLPEDLRRERVVYDVPDADKVCPCCQAPRVAIGQDTSEQLDYQPAKLFVREHVRLKYACPNCTKAAAVPEPPSPTTPGSASLDLVDAPPPSGCTSSTPAAIGSTVVVVASKPAQPIDKGLPGSGLLAFVITSKYCDHLPLHRQEMIIGRMGVELSRSTLCGWMAASADLLRPLADAMLADVLLSRVVQTDETRLPVQEQGNTKTKSGRLWTFVGDRDHPHTAYLYTATKARDGPAAILKDYKGFLQADAANVFDGFYRPGDIVEVGCWAHARRYFHDARSSDAARAAEALARIGFFYDVEREAKTIIDDQKLDGPRADALRWKMRQEQTRPKIDAFKTWLDAQALLVLPKSPIAQAINYARNHWEALLRFTQRGFLNIDNNASERALRPAALGRKNYLFTGSDEGGRTTAVLYTLTQTCRRHGIDPFAFLRDVLTRLPQAAFRDLADLFPHRWAESQRDQVEQPT